MQLNSLLKACILCFDGDYLDPAHWISDYWLCNRPDTSHTQRSRSNTDHQHLSLHLLYTSLPIPDQPFPTHPNTPRLSDRWFLYICCEAPIEFNRHLISTTSYHPQESNRAGLIDAARNTSPSHHPHSVYVERLWVLDARWIFFLWPLDPSRTSHHPEPSYMERHP